MSEITELGLQPHLFIIPIVFLVLSVLGVLSILNAHIRDTFDSEWGYYLGSLLTVVAVLAGIIWFIAAVPFNGKYYPYYEVKGTIEYVSNGILDGDDLTSRLYVIQMEGDETPYITDDPRITTLEGEDASLLCKLSWSNWGNSADKWSCDIRSAAYTAVD